MTMISRPLLLFASALLLGVGAFAPSSVARCSTARNSVARLIADDENDAAFLMDKAEECAFSDSCSVDDAKMFLREVVHVQSGCAAGTLAGQDLCDGDQQRVAEIVAHLRERVSKGSSEFGTVRQQAVSGMVLGSVALVAAFALLAQERGHAVPFTAQEWWWAMNGGYLDTMVAHFVRNGGL